MARAAAKTRSAAPRVARYRKRLLVSGTRRVEVMVPAQDAEAIRRLAAMLRAGGEHAASARHLLGDLLPTRMAQSGADLVAFFRASPLVGLELDLERDKSPGRDLNV